MKKKIAALMAAVILTLSSGYPVSANASNIYEHITVNSYDPQMDYSKEIELVLKDGGRYAMQVGAVYEKQRNLKIQKLDLDYPETSYFTKYSSAAEILKVMEDEKKPKYSYEDLYWL